jgi:glycosyltransferase involved in cell wall biosynthesis
MSIGLMEMKSSLKVLMVSTSYPENEKDWRGRFIYNLASALARRKDIALSLWAPPGKLPENLTSAAVHDDALWLSQLSQRGGIAHLLRRRRLLAIGELVQLLFRLARCYRHRQADLCHVNWLQNVLPLWGTRSPALITVLGSDFGLLRLPGMKTLLRIVMRRRRCILAPNAEWMRPTLEQDFGDVAEIRTIPFGVDNAWFSVVRRSPEDIKHWLTITRLTKNKIGKLFEWGEGLFGENRKLHLFGPMQEKIKLPVWVEYHGPAHPDELLQEWFPQASGLITLSRHDEGLPQVLLEAMAAGLPIIASDLPAHRSIVQHHSTGWIASGPRDLFQGLEWLETPAQNRASGEAARAWIKTSIGSWDNSAQLYVEAYRDLLERA